VIGLDTNLLARYFVEEEGADAATQAQRQGCLARSFMRLQQQTLRADPVERLQQ
jgi:predicted nucleic-acid-binding protein